ncbi:MAG: histidine kinase dimerization/phospho-acceptor domain-containing protein, partial [Acidobacteriota bacterium]
MESSAQWSVFAGGIVLGAAVVLAWIWISRRRAGRQPAAWAHDLRTPLASILAYAEILEDGVDEEERGRFLRIIKQEAARIDEMIGRGGGRIPAGTRGRVVPASSSGSATRTVLVVDDDRFIVDATRRLLQRQGFHAVGASGGREALKRARAGRPDLILLDLLMP